MPRALLLYQPVTPEAIPSRVTFFARGMGLLFRREGQSLALSQWSPKTGVHHTELDPGPSVQVHRNGWALTHPSGYQGYHPHRRNQPVYAGIGTFAVSRVTWADSGNGWAALAGVQSGEHHPIAYPGTRSPFLRYGGRVTLTATIGEHEVVITRDSTDMVDPR